jgi:HPt (histidine-containing phosphotransfer) domain-containing protein
MDLPHLDFAVVDMLKDIMGDDFQLLLQTFVADVPIRLQDLNTCLEQGDIPGMEKPAHTLKGSSANMGAILLSSICAELVDQIRAGNVPEPEQMVRKIEQETEVVQDLIKNLLPS